MIVIGLTGGIASGKTTVARTLRRLGARIWDADRASREAVRPGSDGGKALAERFGREFFTASGELDRARLARFVFGHPDRLLQLNRTLHPYILEDMRAHLRRWREEGVLVAVVEAPLLFESGIDGEMDEIWVVSCGEDLQMERLRQRDGFTREEAADRIAAQMPDAERRRRATRIIDTSGDVRDTVRSVKALYSELMEEIGCEKPSGDS
jgi:dephospho-CoA kinase